MNLLLLDPTEEERVEVFRKMCSIRLQDEYTPRNMIIQQLAQRYVARYGEHHNRIIHSDTHSLCEWIDSIADDAIDRLTPEAVHAVMSRHVLWTPQTEILIKHVACIASKKLGLSTVHEDAVAGIHRLYGTAAKRIRATQDA